jgi:hypothetical protein
MQQELQLLLKWQQLLEFFLVQDALWLQHPFVGANISTCLQSSLFQQFRATDV